MSELNCDLVMSVYFVDQSDINVVLNGSVNSLLLYIQYACAMLV